MNMIEVNDTKVQVGLDKFVLGLPYPRLAKTDDNNPPSQDEVGDVAAERNEFVAQMMHIKNMIEVTGKYFVKKTKNKDLKRYYVLSDDDESLVCIFSLGFNFGTGVINLEFNPSKMTTDKWGDLLALLSVTFDGHYQEFYERCVVAHAEFYVDVPDEKLSNLVLIGERRGTTTKCEDSTYLCKRSSPKVVTMYDKAKEQKQDGELVRVEVRINRREIYFKDLVENCLFNPFCNLLVLNVNQLQSAAQSWDHQLASKIKEWGLFEAVKNKHARKMILAELRKNVMPWWQPELIWAVHKDLLLKFKPNYIGGIA